MKTVFKCKITEENLSTQQCLNSQQRTDVRMMKFLLDTPSRYIG